ncbi:MAG TPA: hypothetical protein VIU35_14990 [Chitinophagaceae bacterium]
MKRKKLPYSIRLMRVSLKWTWHALVMITKEIAFREIPKGKRQYR